MTLEVVQEADHAWEVKTQLQNTKTSKRTNKNTNTNTNKKTSTNTKTNTKTNTWETSKEVKEAHFERNTGGANL